VREMELYHGGEMNVIYVVKPNFRRLGPRLGKKMPLLKKALEKADGAALEKWLMDTGRAEIAVDGENVSLDMEDVEVTVQAKEGYAAAGDQIAVVVLSTELTEDLIDEGIYRELLNRIQTLRKELELEYTQRIRLSIKGSERLERVIEERREHLMRETLCVELAEEPLEGADRREVEIEGEPAKILLARARNK
jgi:isoleucyl-tRNA synthetase